MLLRALECLSKVWLDAGEPSLAVEAASEALSLDPYHETGYQLLMRAHHASGNRPAALRAYHRLQAFLAEELGTVPSAESEALYLRLL